MSEMTPNEALVILASILRGRAAECDEPQPCQDCELEAQALAALRQQADETERLRVQLAGCAVAAMSNTRESLVRAKEVQPGDYGWSASYGDCLAAAEREIELREKLEAGQAEPVAWRMKHCEESEWRPAQYARPSQDYFAMPDRWTIQPLYTAPPHTTEKAEPVATSVRRAQITKRVQECLNTEQADDDARSFAEWVSDCVVDTLSDTEASLWGSGFRAGVHSAMKIVERNIASQSAGVAGQLPQGLASRTLLGLQAQLSGLHGSVTSDTPLYTAPPRAKVTREMLVTAADAMATELAATDSLLLALQAGLRALGLNVEVEP